MGNTPANTVGMYHLSSCLQTQCAPTDRRPGEARGGQDPISYHTRHCVGAGLFLHLEGSQLDWQSKLKVLTQYFKKNEFKITPVSS